MYRIEVMAQSLDNVLTHDTRPRVSRNMVLEIEIVEVVTVVRHDCLH